MHLVAWNAAHLALLHSPIDRLPRFSGRHANTIASVLSKESGYRARPSDLIKIKQELLISGTLTCAPIAGVLEFIAQTESAGIRWGVASNSNRIFVEAIIGKFGLNPHIISTAEDVIKPKPAPDLFWHCANLMKILPIDRGKTVVFEDSVHGIESAIAAGMRAWGIATNCEPAALIRSGAEKVFRNFSDLKQDADDLFT